MAIEKWVAGSGVGLTWTSCFGTELNSLVQGNAVLSSVTIANATPLDVLADVSCSITVTTSGLGYLGIYLYPLNQDGTTYGDGRFTTSAAGPPMTNYYIGAIPSAGTTAVGLLSRVIIPPGSFRFLMYNNAGNNFSAGAGTVSYRTYNRQVV